MSLQLNNVTAGYTKVPVITDITFDVNPGEILRPNRAEWCRKEYDN